jgi:DNA-binding XRE family transcriptional regulator
MQSDSSPPVDMKSERNTWLEKAGRVCKSCGLERQKSSSELAFILCGRSVHVVVPSLSCGCEEGSLVHSFDLGRAEQFAALEAVSKLPDRVDGRTARFARKSMGMRASDLAVALSCDVSLIESIERDDQRPSRMYVLSLAALLRWAAEDPYWRILSGRLVSLPWRNGQVGVIDLTEPSPV